MSKEPPGVPTPFKLKIEKLRHELMMTPVNEDILEEQRVSRLVANGRTLFKIANGVKDFLEKDFGKGDQSQ